MVDIPTSPSQDFTKTWRYKLGLFLIVAGHLGIIGGVLGGLIGLNAASAGAVAVTGEIVSLASIAFLGKEGFKAIKSKVGAYLKSSYTNPVGKTRFYIGIVLLLTHYATTYLFYLYALEGFNQIDAVGPDAIVWGLNLAEQGDLVLALFLTGEVSFIISLYVLGADWWGKFRGIFVWEASQS